MKRKIGIVAITVVALIAVFTLSYNIAYDSIIYTKAFPSLPKPPSSIPLKDARGETIIVYNINNNEEISDVKRAYNDMLQKNGYRVTESDKDILEVIRQNTKYDITFTEMNKNDVITITKVE